MYSFALDIDASPGSQDGGVTDALLGFTASPSAFPATATEEALSRTSATLRLGPASARWDNVQYQGLQPLISAEALHVEPAYETMWGMRLTHSRFPQCVLHFILILI